MPGLSHLWGSPAVESESPQSLVVCGLKLARFFPCEGQLAQAQSGSVSEKEKHFTETETKEDRERGN